jgi:hypothetical protein
MVNGFHVKNVKGFLNSFALFHFPCQTRTKIENKQELEIGIGIGTEQVSLQYMVIRKS